MYSQLIPISISINPQSKILNYSLNIFIYGHYLSLPHVFYCVFSHSHNLRYFLIKFFLKSLLPNKVAKRLLAENFLIYFDPRQLNGIKVRCFIENNCMCFSDLIAFSMRYGSWTIDDGEFAGIDLLLNTWFCESYGQDNKSLNSLSYNSECCKNKDFYF